MMFLVPSVVFEIAVPSEGLSVQENHAMVLIAGKVLVNEATVLPYGADGSVDNGVVHAIDTVLMPPSLHPGH